jgi:Tfp pilus assembly protein PilN
MILVGLPDYEKCQETYQHFFLLQVSLCISQSNISIHSIAPYSIITSNEQENIQLPSSDKNLFSLFTPPPQTSPYQWLTSTVIIVVIMMSTLFASQKNTYNKAQNLSGILKKLKPSHTQVEIETQKITILRKKSENLKTTLSKLNQYSETGKMLPTFLQTLSDSIPPMSWLNRAYIFYSSTNPHTIEIEGYAHSIQETSLFIKKLENFNQITNVKLTNLQKALDQKNHYLFKITGNLLTSA